MKEPQVGNMRSRIIFERSEVIPSPGGTNTVVVASQKFADGKGLSQVIVEYAGGGSGLIAFYAPRVSMGLSWRSDRELVVRYPNDLPAPCIDATNSSFGRGLPVVYEAVPPSQIQPLTWTREGEIRTLREEQLERGVLVTLEVDGRREHSYSYYDVHERDPSTTLLQGQGFHGGGPSWAGIVHGLVALRAPELAGHLELDPEGDGLQVKSKRRAALQKVAKLVAAAKKDSALIQAAIERARTDGVME